MPFKMHISIKKLGWGVLLLSFFSFLPAALAGPYTGTPNPVVPAPGPGIPGPDQVTGKEYSHELDKDANNVNDDMQVIAWDGTGGVADTFDYNDFGITWTTGGVLSSQVDALANMQDALFFDVINNDAAALFSTRFGPYLQGAGIDDYTGDPIYVESISGGVSTWATADQVDQHGVQNLDGLEVWGDDWPGGDDANRFSLFDDGPTSVYAYNSSTSTVSSYIDKLAIQAALASMGIVIDEEDIDVDATMVYDLAGNDFWETGDWLMFSLWATPNAVNPYNQLIPGTLGSGIAGDEVWVWQNGDGISFLDHGGHLWDSAWTMDRLGASAPIEIDALEAVATPEPGTMILFGFALLGLAGVSRKKRI